MGVDGCRHGEADLDHRFRPGEWEAAARASRGRSQCVEFGLPCVAVAHADGDVRLFWKLYLVGEVDLGLSGNNRFLDWSAGVAAKFSPKWDVRLSWREFATDLKDDALRNDFQRSGLALGVAYAF